MVSISVLMLLITWASGLYIKPFETLSNTLFLIIMLSLAAIGAVIFVREEYATKPEGIKNNGVWFKSLASRGIFGWMLGILLTGFYVILYWYPQFMSGLVQLFDPLSILVSGKPADQWFVYGSLYTFGVLVMGYKFALKYRHNRYQLLRTASVCFFQLGFSFLIPSFLKMMNEPDYYFTYFWPLKETVLKPGGDHWGIQGIVQSSSHGWGWYFVGFSAIMTFIGTPILTYFFGKRWYCSWVCGCGGLAETVGDPFRQLSDKSVGAWKIERWLIHSVLIAVILMTALLWINSYMKGGFLGNFSLGFSKWYGFLIGSMFSGVIGTGFYPILGNRSWCRFGCPQAAILGIFQKKKSRFRITTNGGQCISCGNCSTYCEMGIDVRHYAQRGQDIVRASCVGCGICSAVCPRGVLRLENGDFDIDERADDLKAIHLKDGKFEVA
ncbi:MAG: 4Fe-4S binding protein [Saprospiraceae bacterium]|nr:4Fe-4S binding protein [Saprospiraceae bacterium]